LISELSAAAHLGAVSSDDRAAGNILALIPSPASIVGIEVGLALRIDLEAALKVALWKAAGWATKAEAGAAARARAKQPSVTRIFCAFSIVGTPLRRSKKKQKTIKRCFGYDQNRGCHLFLVFYFNKITGSVTGSYRGGHFTSRTLPQQGAV
jgi:hypothetical protein